MVLRVDKEKGYIDLSKRRVSPEDIAAADERFNKSKMVHSIMRHTGGAAQQPLLCCKIDLKPAQRPSATQELWVAWYVIHLSKQALRKHRSCFNNGFMARDGRITTLVSQRRRRAQTWSSCTTA